jgi:uncharacterized protein (DUF488 family)
MVDVPIYTIGYGARDLGALVSMLGDHDIQYLVDVRSRPYSSYKPEFSKTPLENYLESRGIRYVFMGDTLGGQPEDNHCYTNGKADYEKIASQEFFKKGIERLIRAKKQGRRVVLMCSEGKPENCHRTKLIGKWLINVGIEVLHIDENDEIISQEQVIRRLTGGQLSLFGDDSLNFTSRKRYRDDQDPGDAEDLDFKDWGE